MWFLLQVQDDEAERIALEARLKAAAEEEARAAENEQTEQSSELEVSYNEQIPSTNTYLKLHNDN